MTNTFIILFPLKIKHKSQTQSKKRNSAQFTIKSKKESKVFEKPYTFLCSHKVLE